MINPNSLDPPRVPWDQLNTFPFPAPRESYLAAVCSCCQHRYPPEVLFAYRPYGELKWYACPPCIEVLAHALSQIDRRTFRIPSWDDLPPRVPFRKQPDDTEDELRYWTRQIFMDRYAGAPTPDPADEGREPGANLQRPPIRRVSPEALRRLDRRRELKSPGSTTEDSHEEEAYDQAHLNPDNPDAAGTPR